MPKLATASTQPAATAWLTDETLEDAKQNAASSGNFFNLSKMENKVPYTLRFVGTGITGWVGWTEGKKPHRLKMKPNESQWHPQIKVPERGDPYKFFIAGIVYVKNSDEFKVIEITQKTIINSLIETIQHPSFGQPTGYDITLKKEGSGMETKYTLLALPPAPLSRALAKRVEALEFDMELLFNDGDPLNPKGSSSAEDEDEEDFEDDEEEEEEEEE